ncbi:MAG: IPT/TIG domain-containing protein [Planctomycetota bacterium]|nr:IPT/TIG domain-containing protein [Planctomycetota bacterium]
MGGAWGGKLRVALVVAVVGALAFAHVRLIHPSTGAELFWSNPSSISVVINEAGSDNLPDKSHMTALRNSIDEWNRTPGSSARLVENISPGQQARTDWASDSIHLLYFDEDNSSGYFPSGSGTVAITPIWFYAGGSISDADVLFNGKNFNFTTSGQAGRFDVQDIATHELGHLLGLDHSGVAGASMYPYVDTSVVLHRSLAGDDIGGMREVYPDGSFGRLTGTVRRADNSTVAGAWVSARDSDGRIVGGGLANNLGLYTIEGLDPGDYTLYARPLDQPVSSANLTSGHVVVTDFGATHLPGVYTVAAGQTKGVSDLIVGPDATMSLGRSSDNFPLRVVQGQTTNLTIHGAGLNPGSVLTCSDPSVTVSAISWHGSLVTLSVSVPAGEPRGHLDLEVSGPFGERSILPGGLEVTPPDPVVLTVSPSAGSDSGGTSMVIKGNHFEPGARVVIGDRIYTDGEPGGCQVVDPTTILLSTGATVPGVHDVVVIDQSGVEGRQSSAFTSAAIPTIDTVFPLAGNRLGGTEMVLRGDNFATGLEVRIDGISQGAVTRDSGERVVVTTNGGLEGGPYLLELENPGGGVATSAFAYVRPADPVVTGLQPSEGVPGDVVTLSGANFSPQTQVLFGADPDTGIGGVAADSIEFLGPGTLEVTLPAGLAGDQSVLVRRADTGQADVLEAGISYPTSSDSGGACTASVGLERGPWEALRGSAWMLVLGILVWMRSRRLETA